MKKLLLLLLLGSNLFGSKPFVIIIPSYNNEDFIEKNLRSVFSQKYDNFRVLYIDDHSNDRTLEKATTLLKELDKKNQAELIHNSKNQGGLANIYNAVHTCLDQEICVLLDGDDFFAHENVLSTLNAIYQDEKVWMTYGNDLEYPSYKKKKELKTSFPPLRSFYAALFKEIKLQDLFYRGRFYAMKGDLAIMLPMIGMAKTHAHFIDEILYLSNQTNPLCDAKINPSYAKECEDHIRSRKPYSALKRLKTHIGHQKETADLLIFSQDRPAQLISLLESCEHYITSLNKISVLYQSSSNQTETAYLELKLRFPNIQFVSCMEFKKMVNKIVFDESLPHANYLLLAHDQLIIKDCIDLSKGIQALEETQAYGLYYHLDASSHFCGSLERFQAIPPHPPLPGIPAQETLHTWQFSEGTGDFNTPNTLNFALFRKEDLKKVLQNLPFDSPESLIYEWGHQIPENQIGLFYKNSKCIER